MSANCTDRIGKTGGFTLVELVLIIVLLGILSVVILPRFNASGFTGDLFRDEVASVLRYAQKAATSRRRLVCVSIEPRTVSLAVATAAGATSCNQNLQLAGGGTTLESKDTAVTISPAPLMLYFQPNGRITADGSATTIYNASLSINEAQLTIVGETGHVR